MHTDFQVHGYSQKNNNNNNNVCFVCWLELDSSIALCNVEQFLNPICYFYQYFGPQWDLFQDIQLAFGLSSCKQCLLIWN